MWGIYMQIWSVHYTLEKNWNKENTKNISKTSLLITLLKLIIPYNIVIKINCVVAISYIAVAM